MAQAQSMTAEREVLTAPGKAEQPRMKFYIDVKRCIECGDCLYACPFGVPQFPKGTAFGVRGIMDKCTYCSGGPEVAFSEKERGLYGSNRIAEGKLPMCASVCATKALVAGEAEEVDKLVR